MAVDRLQKNGIFYYNRRIPDDVSTQYASKRVVFSLKTQSRPAAVKSGASVTSQLEKKWLHFRTRQWPIPILTTAASLGTMNDLSGVILTNIVVLNASIPHIIL